jgi:hypothetical protein
VGAMYSELALRMVTASPDLLGSSTPQTIGSSDPT